MYRDIKPDNIGFDIRGDIKIFDFGLAKEFDPNCRDERGCFHLTGDTGSPRYMDPTVALGKPYNELCDVYSFCILLWEMLMLSVPYEGYTMKMFMKKVVNEGARPRISTEWSPNIQKLLSGGFGNLSHRPSMANVCDAMRTELSCCCKDEFQDASDLERQTGKSDLSSKALQFKTV
jgi:serine/threonine protein kinase